MRGRRFNAVLGSTLMASTLLCHADPIHDAAKRGDQGAVNRIVAAQPEALEARDAHHGNTPLHWAASQGHVNVALTLLQNGANPNSRTKDGYTPLRDAAYRGNTKVVELLLESGARVDAKDKGGATPLHWAGHSGQTAAAKLLLNAGAPSSLEDNFGTTPVEWAREAGQPRCAQVMQRNLWGQMSESILDDDRDALARMLKRYPGLANLEIGLRESSPYPESRPICEATNMAQLELLLDAGADPLAKILPTGDGTFVQTPLHYMQGELLERVLKDGVDPDVAGEADITPLARAVWHHNLDKARMLLRYGASPRRANLNGNTPLHVMADETGRFLGRRELSPERHIQIAQALIEAGADPNLRNSQGFTARELALKNDHMELATYLGGVR
jgi:ankyrin repeat protein